MWMLTDSQSPGLEFYHVRIT
ncbi:hypothetical protein LINPERHAP1_LOCUS39573 [Linum perenne]